jgi:hypothetical protein
MLANLDDRFFLVKTFCEKFSEIIPATQVACCSATRVVRREQHLRSIYGACFAKRWPRAAPHVIHAEKSERKRDFLFRQHAAKRLLERAVAWRALCRSLYL